MAVTGKGDYPFMSRWTTVFNARQNTGFKIDNAGKDVFKDFFFEAEPVETPETTGISPIITRRRRR